MQYHRTREELARYLPRDRWTYHADPDCPDCQGRGVPSELLDVEDATPEELCDCITDQCVSQADYEHLSGGDILVVPARGARRPQ